MGDLINGRTPEEIKNRLACCSKERGCYECPDVAWGDCSLKLCADALAYIERLEAAQPKWISVKERLPEEVCRCLVITKRHEESSMVNTATYNHMGWWTHGNFGEVTHWMPLPEPPKEEA